MPESNRKTRRVLSRLAGATFVGGLTISLLPGLAGAVPEAVQATDEFCANVPEDYPSFPDVSGNADNIRCLAYSGITTGTDEGNYEPGEIVNREQMASFIARLLDLAIELDADGDLFELPEDDGTAPFDDPISDAHAGNVNRLFQAGIVQGGPGGTDPSFYGAGLPVTRAQMASFINRAVDYLLDGEVDDTGDYESDENIFVDNTVAPHVENVNGLANRGIVQGFSGAGGSYAPLAGVTRDQMASFLIRTAAQLYDDGEIDQLPPPTELTLTPDSTGPFASGGAFTGTLAGGPIDSVSVSSTCTPEGALTDNDLAVADFQFNVPIDDPATPGACVVSFTVVSEGATVVFDVPITIAAPTTNQTLDFGPDDAQDVTFLDDTVTDDPADNRTFTATGLTQDQPYRITLVDSENVSVDAGGVVAFVEDAATGLALAGSDPRGVIRTVNGAAPASGTPRSAGGVVPVNGEITIVVDGVGNGSVTPVIYVDGGASTRLELDGDGLPVEDFGIAGATRFLAPEAPQGTSQDGTVVFLSKGENFYVLDDGYLYRWDDTDAFTYENDLGYDPIDLEEFEAYLNIGDYLHDLTGSYETDPAAVNEFNFHDDFTSAPTGVDAAVGDFDAAGGADADDVQVTFQAATDGWVLDYTVSLVADLDPATPACEPGAEVDSETDADTTATFLDLPNGSYCGVVYATSQSFSGSADALSDVVTVDVDPPVIP